MHRTVTWAALVMATADRVGDLAVLRLGGATRCQILRIIALETVLFPAAGTVLGIVVAAGMVAVVGAYLSSLMDQPVRATSSIRSIVVG